MPASAATKEGAGRSFPVFLQTDIAAPCGWASPQSPGT
jgi:hypothetical protein